MNCDGWHTLHNHHWQILCMPYGLGLRDDGPLQYVLRFAMCAFGHTDVARAWLTHMCPELGGAHPAVLIKTDDGLDMVDAALDQIWHLRRALRDAKDLKGTGA